MTSYNGYSPKSPNRYLAPNVFLSSVVTRNRAPTGADYRQPETGKLYPTSSFWLVAADPTTGTVGDLWYLSKIVANVAYWVMLSTGGGGPIIEIGVQATTAPGVSPVEPTGGGLITINGAAVANHSVVLETRSRALNVFNLEVQYSAAAAATDATKSGVSHFNSDQFSVDASGFVSLAGAGLAIDSVQVDTFTGPGTNPVVPSAAGLITVTGAQVATGTIGANVVRTNSLAANTYTIQVQRSTAVAAADSTKNGVSHFNNAQFSVDADGFVSLGGSGLAIDSIAVDAATGPGTNPVVPTVAGLVTVTGGQVASAAIGANVIRTNSLAANTYTIEVQRAGSAVAQDTTLNGVAHFDSADFTVVNGFVTLAGGSTFAPNANIQIFDDFIGSGQVAHNTSQINGQMTWYSTFFTLSTATSSAHPGVIENSSGGTILGIWSGFIESIVSYRRPIILGGGSIALNWVVNLATLSVASPRYELRVGLSASTGGGGGDFTDGVYFEYCDNINGGNWVYKTANGSVRTTTNSAVAVTSGWHNLGIVINAAGTSIEYFVDGVSLGAAIATNIPTAAIGPTVEMEVKAGAIAAGQVLVDLFYMNQALTTPR